MKLMRPKEWTWPEKILVGVFVIGIIGIIFGGLNKHEPLYSPTLIEEMAKIDNNRFSPASYQSLLNDIQQECPNYTQQRIADMAAASYMSMKNEHGIKDTYLETLYGIKESVSGNTGACKQFKLEQIIAGYATIRISLK